MTLKELSTTEKEEKPIFETPKDTFSLSESKVVVDFDDWQKMKEKVEELEKRIGGVFEQKEIIKFKKISESEAKKEITDFILQMKEKSISKISILDIVCSLNLPPEQIERVMEQFKSKKKVSEVYE